MIRRVRLPSLTMFGFLPHLPVMHETAHMQRSWLRHVVHHRVTGVAFNRCPASTGARFAPKSAAHAADRVQPFP